MPADITQLESTLRRIDRRGYKAYRDIAGSYAIAAGVELHIDYVQGDPFAAPSKIRLRVGQQQVELPEALRATQTRRTALADFIARQVRQVIVTAGGGRCGSGKSGLVSIDAGGQEVLERTAVVLNDRFVEARLEVGLPAAGRKVLGREAIELLCHDLPAIADAAFYWRALPQADAQAFVECVENQACVRDQLAGLELVAFVADGAILPRESGASDRPLAFRDAVPFTSPPSLRVAMDLPNEAVLPDGVRTRQLTGMGVPEGVTLIVGGGYHGKSTLLDALQRAVYPHVPGDGREYVVTRPEAVKIRAEDGRRVERVDIAAFISELPRERSTAAFRSDDASGSTSQAANIVEAIEIGATALLLDEDTSATNFMVRDARMQRLVHKAHEPITPFVDRVGELYGRLGVSTVLVMGGSGDYFDAADTVILMRAYQPADVTAEAKAIAADMPSSRRSETPAPLGEPTPRVPLAASLSPARGRKSVKIQGRGTEQVSFGEEEIDLRQVEQIIDRSQTRAIGCALHLARQYMDGHRTLAEILHHVQEHLVEHGLDALDPFHRPGEHPGNFARPRRAEVAAAINRLRTVQMRQARANRQHVPETG